jgi:hypothetical protein
MLLLVGACQANPEPSPFAGPESTAPAATPPSASPTATPPELPRAATGTDRAAAKAFVRHYIDLVNHAMATGDVAPVVEASGQACESCEAVVDRVQEVYEQGGSIESQGWKITVISPVPGQPKLSPMFDLGLRLTPQRVFVDATAEPRRFDGGKLPATFLLTRHDGGWVVKEWERSS